MISSETPDKLRDIIMDTYPQLFYLKDARKLRTGRDNETTKK